MTLRNKLPSLILPGGFESNFTMGYVRGLIANGVKILVLACDETAPRLAEAAIPHLNVRRSVSKDRQAWRKAVNLLGYYARTLALLFHHRGGVVHFTGIFQTRRILLEGIFLNLCIRLSARRYLYTVHNVLPHGREKSRALRWIYQRIYRVPDLLFVHTGRVKEQLIKEFQVPASKIHLTSIGLNEEMPSTSLSPEDARRRLGFCGNERPILFFGKIEAYKGLDLLIEAFDRLALPNTRLVIAGSFRDPAYREAILEQLAKAGRRGEIYLHERFIPNEEVELFFKGCEVLCLPYRNIYQSGLVFLGLRFGIPIVATNVGALGEYIDSSAGGICGSNEAAGIAAGLAAFFAQPHPPSREAIRRRAESYGWDRICAELVPFYGSASLIAKRL